MQWPEIFVLAVVAAAAWTRVDERLEPYAPASGWVALALLAIELAYRGPAMQLLPLALAALLLAIGATRVQRPGVNRAFGLGALALVSTSVGLLVVLPFFLLPKPTGPFAVGTRLLFLTDESRALNGGVPPQREGNRRELVVQIWYPAELHAGGGLARYVRRGEVKPLTWYWAGLRTNSVQNAPLAGPGEPFPVLLYGHSWGSRRTVDTFLAEDLASHGYVVVAIDHALNTARMELADGQVIRSDRAKALEDVNASPAAAVEALWDHEVTIWVADQQFVLGQLRAGGGECMWTQGALDFRRVGAFGHSFGGAASFAMLGAEGDGPPVQAAANLDGWSFGALKMRTDQPILMVYAGTPPPRQQPAAAGPRESTEAQLDRADRAAVEGSLDRFGGEEVYVGGTQHLDFTDQTLLSPFQRVTYTGPLAGERARAITRELVLGFFDRTLRGVHTENPHDPEVQIKQFAGERTPGDSPAAVGGQGRR